MTTRTSALALSVLTGLAVLAPGGAALADPKGHPFTITCGTRTFQAVTSMGKGEFIPAHVVGSNVVLVPVWFGLFTGTISNTTGYTDTFTDGATLTKKGSGKQRNVTSCTYRFTETFTLTATEAAKEDLPGAGTYTFVGTGTVGLQIRGR